MARKRYSDEDILKLIREIEVHIHGGMDVVSACHKSGVSDKTYYSWRKKFGAWLRSAARPIVDGKLFTVAHNSESPCLSCSISPEVSMHCRRRWLYPPGVFSAWIKFWQSVVACRLDPTKARKNASPCSEFLTFSPSHSPAFCTIKVTGDRTACAAR